MRTIGLGKVRFLETRGESSTSKANRSSLANSPAVQGKRITPKAKLQAKLQAKILLATGL
jgi:hypothetical protein